MEYLVSAEARVLVADALRRDRLLITGASGWLGRTALDLVAPLGLPTLALASRRRSIRVGDHTVECRVWDPDEVASFGPTIVLDCAYLNMARKADVSVDEFIRNNRRLNEQLLFAAGLPGVRLALTVSSGAAVHPRDALAGSIDDNPYGYLKREAEHLLMDTAGRSGVVPVVLRAWSLSGAHVQNPRSYALGSQILGAAAGAITVTARRPVYRRYVLAEELLALGIAEGAVGPAIIDSGGELVEVGELASRVAAVIRPDAVISRAEVDPADPDRYHSDGRDWERRCRRWGLDSRSLDSQIEITARGVLANQA